MDDFQRQLQELPVSGFQAGQMMPHDTQGQYSMDQTRQFFGGSCFSCARCFFNCFNCFFFSCFSCSRCFFNCFSCHNCHNCHHCHR